MNGEIIPSHTVVWAAGVRGAEIGDHLGVPVGRKS